MFLVSRTGSSDTFVKLDTLMMTVVLVKFALVIPGEDFSKILKLYQKMIKIDYKV